VSSVTELQAQIETDTQDQVRERLDVPPGDLAILDQAASLQRETHTSLEVLASRHSVFGRPDLYSGQGIERATTLTCAPIEMSGSTKATRLRCCYEFSVRP